MPAQAMFKESWFALSDGEKAPDHADDFPQRGLRDPALHHIEGYIPNDGDFVWLAINLSDEATAVRMLEAARRRLKADIEAAGGLRTDMVSNAALVRPGNEGRYESIHGRADQ